MDDLDEQLLKLHYGKRQRSEPVSDSDEMSDSDEEPITDHEAHKRCVIARLKNVSFKEDNLEVILAHLECMTEEHEQKLKTNTCKHPSLLCANGYPLCKSEEQAICPNCNKKVLLHDAECFENCNENECLTYRDNWGQSFEEDEASPVTNEP